MADLKVCQYCTYYTRYDHQLIQHTIRYHKHSDKISFRCNICGAVFKNSNAYRSHKFRKHQGVNEDGDISAVNELQFPLELGIRDQCDKDNEPPISVQQHIEACYLLKLKEKHGLSDELVSDIMTSTKELIDHYQQAKTDDGSRRLFQGLESSYMREGFFKTKMNYVEPIALKLGEDNKLPNNIKIAFAQYIPFLPSVKNLLAMPEVEESISLKRDSKSVISDIFDGLEMKRKCPVIEEENGVLNLLFSLYLDDLEIANPIGAHAKIHKITVFYWQLLNIPPYLRSKLTSIQLLAVAKQKDLKKFPTNLLLETFKLEMKEMATGVQCRLNGVERVVKGKLAFVLGDTLAAQEIGGFKEGVGNAYKFCRTCEINKTEINSSILSETFPLRDEHEHNDRLTALANCNKKATVYWSRKYGVNKKSDLLGVPDFQVTKDLLIDPMHVLLEGIVKYETRLILHHFIYNLKLFSLDQLNYAIQSFRYKKYEREVKPSLIERKHLMHSGDMKQTASAMKTLIFLMPLYIGSEVPVGNPHWKNYLILTQITQICLSSVANESAVINLKCLIAEHNENFIILYPDSSFTPKMHYLIHLPEQLKNYGPIRYHSCMRFESKHSYFKGKKWRCFKSVPKTMAFKHQRWLCLQQANGYGGKNQHFLGDIDQIKEGYECNLEEDIKALLFSFDANAADIKTMHVSPAISIYGHVYESSTVLVQSFSDEGGPTFMIVDNPVCINLEAYVIGIQTEIDYFDAHLNRYVCTKPNFGRKLLYPIKKTSVHVAASLSYC